MPGDSRRVSVTIDADTGPYARGLATATAETKAFSRELRSANSDADRFTRNMDTSGRQIDKLSGRLELLGQFAGALGPALIPIGAAAIPAVAGLANQLGIAALAGGTAVLAFQGVGTALKALDQYQLQPTAAHFQAMQIAMSAVGPAGREFVRQLEDMRPLLTGIQNTARAGLLPGVTDALEGIATRAPEVNHLIETISSTLGDLFSEAGAGIEGGALDSFIRTLDEEARPALTDLGHSIADVTLGLTDLFRAFVPLSLDFGSGMAKAAAGFHAWAEGLSATQGFQDFISYLRSTGPQVLDLLGALGDDFVQIAEAAAPLGGPILQSLTAVAKALGAIADSPLGTPIFTAISAISAYNLALKATTALQEKAFGSRVIGNVKSFGSSFRGMTSEVEAANAQLRTAQAELSAVGARARTAQSALIPTPQKRAAIRDYAVAQGRVKTATEEVAAAEERAGAARRSSLASIGKSAAAVAGIGLVASGAADKFGLTNTATLGLAGSMAGPLGAALGVTAGAMLDVAAASSKLRDDMNAAQNATDFGKTEASLQRLQARLSDLQHHTGVGDFFADMFTSTSTTQDRLRKQIDATKQTLADLNGEATKGSPALAAYNQSLRNSGVAAGHTKAEINGMVSAMLANKQAAISAFDAETNYRQALKAAQAQAAKNSAGIKGNSDAAIQNRRALSGLASAWANQSDAVRNNVGRFREARSAFIQTAVAMGVPIGKAHELARSMIAIPKALVIKAQIVGGLRALEEIDAIKARLAGIPRSISTSYYVHQINSLSKAPVNLSPSHGKYATGGYTGDRPAHEPVGVVHGREFVFDAAATAKAGVDNLYALQRQLRGYADGGFVGGPWGTPSWSGNWQMPPAQTRLRVREKVNIDGVGVFSVTRADRDNAEFIATLVHQTHREKAADRLAELQAMQQIRDFQKQLSAHNKKKKDGSGGGLSLTGLDRKETLAELAQAQQGLADLKSHADGAKQAIQQVKDALNTKRSGLQSAAGGLNFDQALGIQPTNPIAAQVHDSLAQFKAQIVEAGGVWTKHLANLSSKTINQAIVLDKANRKQAELTDQVNTTTQSLADLRSTMSQFGSSVAANFETNPFGLGGQSSTFTPTVDNSPALSAATDQLNAAKAHLAALSTNDGSIGQRLANAAAASQVEQTVGALQAQVDQLSQPVTTVTDSLQAFHDTLTSDIDRANAFNAALTTLAGDGLSTDFLSALSTSGDTAFATALAGAGEQTAQQYAALFDQRNAAAAQIAATATQAVYGQQQATLVASLTTQQAALDAANALISAQTTTIETQGGLIVGALQGQIADLKGQVAAVAAAVAAQPHTAAQIKRAGKGRG